MLESSNRRLTDILGGKAGGRSEEEKEPEGRVSEEQPDPSRAFATVKGANEKALKVEFRKLKGPWEILDYGWMPRIKWNPSGELLLCFDLGFAVAIRGRNLHGLKESFRRHRVVWVQEQGPDALSERTLPDDAVVIYAIEFRREIEPPGQ